MYDTSVALDDGDQLWVDDTKILDVMPEVAATIL